MKHIQRIEQKRKKSTYRTAASNLQNRRKTYKEKTGTTVVEESEMIFAFFGGL